MKKKEMQLNENSSLTQAMEKVTAGMTAAELLIMADDLERAGRKARSMARPRKPTCWKVSPQNEHPSEWENDIEIYDIMQVEDWKVGEENPLNALYTDNRGRFFLAKAKWDADPLDMPRTAFKEVDFLKAMEWASHAQQHYASSSGELSALLNEALRRLKSRKS